MPRGPSKFRQTDVTRLMRAAEAAGKTAKQLEYDPERGKIVLVIGEPDKSSAGHIEKNEWDEVFNGATEPTVRK